LTPFLWALPEGPKERLCPSLRPVGEGIDALSQRRDPFQLHVLLVSHFNQESLYSRETPCDWLDDGGDDGLNFSTTCGRFGHSVVVSWQGLLWGADGSVVLPPGTFKWRLADGASGPTAWAPLSVPLFQSFCQLLQFLLRVPDELRTIQAGPVLGGDREERCVHGHRGARGPVVHVLRRLATSGVCGGGLVVESGGKKRGRIPEYICHRHRTSGEKACHNALRIAVTVMNEAVLSAIEEHALTEEAIEQVIQLSERGDVQDIQKALDKQTTDIAKRIARLAAAIETGGDSASVLLKIRELEARQAAIKIEGASLRPVPRLPQPVIANRLAEWRRLLRASTMQGRTVLQRILRGRITFKPRADGDGYDFTAPTRFDRLFAGIVASRPDPEAGVRTGLEHIGPEDTFDADCGVCWRKR
jgi:hypothetical protein